MGSLPLGEETAGTESGVEIHHLCLLGNKRGLGLVNASFHPRDQGHLFPERDKQ